MKALKIILNVFGIIFSSILSVILVAVLLVAPIFSAGTAFTKPKTIKKIITSIDLSEVFSAGDGSYSLPDEEKVSSAPTVVALGYGGSLTADSVEDEVEEQFKDSLEERGVPAEILEKLMETEAVDQILDLISEDIAAALKGDASGKLTPEMITKIIKDNIDEIATIIYDYVGEEKGVSLAEVKAQIEAQASSMAPEIVGALDGVKQSISASDELNETVKVLASGAPALGIWGLIALLTGLIYLLRFPRFKGLIWLGSVYGVGALFSLLCFAFVGTAAGGLLESMMGNAAILTPLIKVVSASYGWMALAYFLIAAAAITGFILLQIRRKKKSAACEAAAMEAELEPIAVEIVNAEAADNLAGVVNEQEN